MHVLILGVGDAFTSRHFGTSAIVQAPGGYVLIDCPDLIHRALREASAKSKWPVSAPAIDDILLTHLHGDHCNGLESFGFFRRIHGAQDRSKRRPRLHVTQPVADRLWERLGPAMETPIGEPRPSVLSDYFDVHILRPDSPSQVAGLTVACRFTKHPVPTVGFRLTDGACTFAWSGDTPFESAHIDWLNEADVIVHESNLSPSHTPIEKLNALADAVRRKIRLIHLTDDFDAATTDMPVLREGEVIDCRCERRT